MAAPRKTNRQARRRVASNLGVATLKIDEAQWGHLQEALGATLGAQVREQIRAAAQECISEAYGEQNAPFADDVDARLAKIRTAAKALDDALAGQGGVRDKTDFTTRYYLGGEYREYSGGADLDSLRSNLSALIGAADLTRRRVQSMQAAKDGDAWRGFVKRSTLILAGHGLPTGAPKDRPLSPYLRFLKAMATIHEAFSRHTGSTDALQGAVYRARKRPPGHSAGNPTVSDDPDGTPIAQLAHDG